jgi:hypothetical protein
LVIASRTSAAVGFVIAEMVADPREESERVIVAAIEKHARGDVEALRLPLKPTSSSALRYQLGVPDLCGSRKRR